MRFTVLDSWRGICALWVAIYHFRILSDVHAIDLFRHGSLAVEFFFVLSGFVLTCAYGERVVTGRDQIRFMVRRFGRLYPLHFATLLTVVLLELGRWMASVYIGSEIGSDTFSGSTDLVYLVPNLLLIHGIGLIPDFTWNVPSWSISVEFLLCIIFSCVILFPYRLAAVVVLLIVGLLSFVFLRYGISEQSESSTALARGVYSFFTGSLVYRLYKECNNKCISPPSWMEWFLIPIFLISPSVDQTPVPALLFGLLIFVFAFESGSVSSLLKHRIMVRLGEISYSIYLVHYPVVLVLFGVAAIFGQIVIVDGAPWIGMTSKVTGDVAVIIYCCVILGISIVTYRWIESPGRDYFNRLSRRF